MEQIESLLSVITFILKSLNHGQIDDMDLELLKSFSLSHLAIAEDLKSFPNNVSGSNPDQNKCKTDSRSNALFKSSLFALETKQENHNFETINAVDDHDQINIFENPIEMDLTHQANKEMNEQEPKEHINENNETEVLEVKKEKRRSREKKIQINVIVFRCLFCDLDFREEEEFHKHDSENHFKDGKFHCVCNEAFNDKKDAVNHFMSDHKKKNIYPCSECTEFFFGKRELTEHLKDVHSKLVSPRQCPICLDGVTYGPYDSKNSLRKHMYHEHTNLKFKCDICETNFITREGFVRHKKLLHGGERIKYTCEECSQDYYSEKAYENHISKHNGEPSFSCEKCSKKFYTTFYLQAHRNEHICI